MAEMPSGGQLADVELGVLQPIDVAAKVLLAPDQPPVGCELARLAVDGEVRSEGAAAVELQDGEGVCSFPGPCDRLDAVALIPGGFDVKVEDVGPDVAEEVVGE